MTPREELQALHRAALLATHQCQQHQAALVSMYDAAISRGATIEADQYRAHLHVVLDMYLDATARVTDITRQLILLR